MSVIDAISCSLIAIGALFFLAGSIGLLRLPDVFTRLHALTKADNLGLGFTIAGLLLQSASPRPALKLILIWLLVLVNSATICCLIAGCVERHRSQKDHHE